MKQQLLFLLFALIPVLSLAQASADTLHVVGMDSIDSLNERLSSSGDAARIKHFQLDSMRTGFNATADSLQGTYHTAIAEVNAKTKKIDHTIDSLEKLNLRANKYKRRLGKLSEVRQKAEAQFTYKLNALKKKTTDKLSALNLPPEYKEDLQKISQQIGEITLNSDVIKLPELDIPGYDMPSLNSISNASSLEGLTNGTDLSQLSNLQPPADVSDATQQMQGYEGDLDKIADADITNTETLQKTVESQASKIDGIDQLQKQSGVIDAHKTKLDELADPEKGKKKAVELARKAAVDHFAGKQEQLKAAMEKISKYKKKYSSVS